MGYARDEASEVDSVPDATIGEDIGSTLTDEVFNGRKEVQHDKAKERSRIQDGSHSISGVGVVFLVGFEHGRFPLEVEVEGWSNTL